MSNSREDDAKVMGILAAARQKPAPEREAYVRSACAGDASLQREVAEALSWEERMGGFLQQPVAVIASEPPPDDAATGAVQFPTGLAIGQYRVESKLGEGGMSTVWLALDIRLGRRVAIKVLSNNLADTEARRRFRREAEMVSSLNHPHIVTVYDINEFEGRHFLVTEYVDGGTLRDWIKDQPRTPKEVIELLTGVADGLAAAHQAGILHRDIKPLNILVARNGYAKLADFGLAKLAESGSHDLAANALEGATRPGLILGTIAYMSPEQASGHPLDARSDIFSFGVVLYEMLSGRRPFSGRTDLEVLKTIIDGDMPPLSKEVPEAYRRVVQKALKKSPAERYQSMREMVAELRQGQPMQPLPPRPPAQRAASSSAWLKIGAATFAVAALALSSIEVYRRLRPQPPPPPAQVNLNPVPFTALPGQATSPAFSSDGSRIAFAWNGDPKAGTKGFDLYVKALGSETLLRLTQHAAESISPAWSPDGTQIAFSRSAGADIGIYVVPALGGMERKLRTTRMPSNSYTFVGSASVAPISWSPDGKWIAFADMPPGEEHSRIYFLSVETLETTPFSRPSKCVGERLPAFSHNGKYLAFWCSRQATDGDVLYSARIPDGQLKEIASYGFPNGLTWSADDEKLIYSSYVMDSGLGEATVADGSSTQLAFSGPAMLPTVRRETLAYASLSTHLGIQRRDLLHLDAPAVNFLSSSRTQWGARYSPDGKHIVFPSLRSGTLSSVWLSDEHGSHLVQVSNPQDEAGSPRWSPDGNRIAFDARPNGQWEIYTADIAEMKPRKLVTNVSNLSRPSWSRDGKWIYFSAQQPGKMGIYRAPASGGDAVLLSKDSEASDPQESFDGKTLYFASPSDKSNLKSVPLAAQPGTKWELEGFPRLRNCSLWELSPGGIYFVADGAPRSLRYFDFATRKIRTVFELNTDFGTGLSVSPDGRWLLYTQTGDASGDIMLVEHVH